MPFFSLALVTGATSGIGKSLARLLANQKINLILTGRNEVELEELRAELSILVEVEILNADLLKIQDRKAIIEVIHKKVPDLVINSAGYGLYGYCLSFTTEEQCDILELNGTALVELTLETARTLFSNEKKGVIMNISSASAFYALPLMSMYAASKAFVNQFSLAFDEEMKPYGIRILTACPGMVDTHFRERAGGSKKKKDDPMIMTAEHVAEKIWKQIVDKKELKVIDWKYSFMKLFSNLFPRSWLSALLKKNILERIEPRPFIKISHESRKPK